MSGPRKIRHLPPPAAPGNFLGVKHGVQSQRIVSALAEEELNYLVAEFPHISRFSAGAARYAIAMAKIRLILAWLDDVGVVNEHGEPYSMSIELARWIKIADHQASRLGLDPISAAKMLHLAEDRNEMRRALAEGDARAAMLRPDGR
jgi:hypothetical protein